ncbi:hypothetical protein K493DRAFT_316367 [Basidiobolus meristosporus CBS 931.73]|uniref:Uncharacterized protein n=1 Tax=Basidiobolus meristosporus CBS 931.73 TaxID=1314790 RepID=A0A1Y1Y459_9FUNG|nr:hypothetical protein K493DRAFT_316367 [Basidiobolus meristosporus CBS 931.73]|eukprot:ORX92811.1 hypothetical protein K493DRAFT_316367 [Basidiobolus meristosporus CBS 931.73]
MNVHATGIPNVGMNMGRGFGMGMGMPEYHPHSAYSNHFPPFGHGAPFGRAGGLGGTPPPPWGFFW